MPNMSRAFLSHFSLKNMSCYFKEERARSKMPGENCCIVNCSVSRQNKGIGLFKLPSKRFYPEWRNQWLHIITEHLVVDKSFKNQIEDD